MSKVVINGYIENIWAKRFATYQQTLGVMGYISLNNKIIISSRKHDIFTQPIRIEIDYGGDKPFNPGLEFINKVGIQ